jgi:hypothetical protein
MGVESDGYETERTGTENLDRQTSRRPVANSEEQRLREDPSSLWNCASVALPSCWEIFEIL